MIFKILKRARADSWDNIFSLIFAKLAGVFYKNTVTLGYELDLSDYTSYIHQSNVIISNELEVDNIFHLSKKDITHLHGDDGICFQAYIENALVGYAFVKYGVKKVEKFGTIDLGVNRLAWIGPVFVHKKYRGLGINKVLVNYAAANCKQRGCRYLLTSINSGNLSSINSFERIGFKKSLEIQVISFFTKTVKVKRIEYGEYNHFGL